MCIELYKFSDTFPKKIPFIYFENVCLCVHAIASGNLPSWVLFESQFRISNGKTRIVNHEGLFASMGENK